VHGRACVAGRAAQWSLRRMRDYNDEFARVSTHLGHVTFSLVLTLQCLVFVVGVLSMAASVARSAVFLLLCAVDPAAARHLHHHTADYVVLIDTRQPGDDASAPVINSSSRRCPTSLTEHSPHDNDDRLHAYLSTCSDTVSLATFRLFSETKV